MSTAKKPESVGAMSVYSDHRYYCSSCNNTMNKTEVEDNGEMVKTMRCMNGRCKFFMIHYLEPTVKVTRFIPTEKKPEKATPKVAKPRI